MTESVDVESIVARIVSVVQANINSKLSAIDSAKDDGIVLKQFVSPSVDSDGSYSILSTDAAVMNFNPFLYIGAQMPGVQSLGPASAVDLEIDLVTILDIEGGDANVWKRLLRYQRALKEVMQENFGDLNIPGNIYVENLEPRPIEELGDKPYMGAGIRLKTSLA